MNCLCVQASMKERRSTKCRRLMARNQTRTQHHLSIFKLSWSKHNSSSQQKLWLLPICSILVSGTLGYTATCVCFRNINRLALCWALFLIHGIWPPRLLIFMCFRTFLIFLWYSSVPLSPFLPKAFIRVHILILSLSSSLIRLELPTPPLNVMLEASPKGWPRPITQPNPNQITYHEI